MVSDNSANRVKLMADLKLTGLTLAPPQVFGGVRLIPLLRDDVRDDLRLVSRAYSEDFNIVSVDKRQAYYSWVPHALVATWSSDGQPATAFGAQISKPRSNKTSDGRVEDYGFCQARVMNKMRAREAKNSLRFLPLHLAMEGFLSLYFGGPEIAWEEYSRAALQTGLGSRSETVVPGWYIEGLKDALRVFEIHDSQVGVLVMVADALASAFVVPHPDDYRLLHRTLITDFYGDLIGEYSLGAQEHVVTPDFADVGATQSIEDLHEHLQQYRKEWAELNALMASGLFGRSVVSERVYKMGPFLLQRFATDLDQKSDNHIGEAITGPGGTLEYLKTFRLSRAQCRRAYLLKQLAESDWELEACAQRLACTKNQLIFRLENAGFGYLLHQHVLDAARASRRTR